MDAAAPFALEGRRGDVRTVWLPELAVGEEPRRGRGRLGQGQGRGQGRGRGRDLGRGHVVGFDLEAKLDRDDSEDEIEVSVAEDATVTVLDDGMCVDESGAWADGDGDDQSFAALVGVAATRAASPPRTRSRRFKNAFIVRTKLYLVVKCIYCTY
eukprot:SAG11_NODE_6225_length_1359_cov_1.605556_1_plen_155_part_00